VADHITQLTITSLNKAAATDVEGWLRPCCASGRWVDEMLRLRPYSDLTALREHSEMLLDALPWPDLREAIDAHPRIGDRAEGADTESGWSRQEQAAAASDDDRVKAELVQANKEYEAKFGYVFLICATGLSASAILDAARQRLANSPEDERTVVRTELTRIVALRLEKLVSG
jgi:2-oxo-4-hydroxy-4-carboxy-5-ureidoimidazoline decarboxylase